VKARRLPAGSVNMHRRTTRLRREYVYRKSLESKAREEYEKKSAIRAALQEGKPIPTELRAESQKLKHEIDLEDDNTAVPRTHIDDEYSRLGLEDPKVLAICR
jgi:U3 small nucleolar ribonucleoprotein protein IMP4